MTRKEASVKNGKKGGRPSKERTSNTGTSCPECAGKGKIFSKPTGMDRMTCPYCAGEGTTEWRGFDSSSVGWFDQIVQMFDRDATHHHTMTSICMFYIQQTIDIGKDEEILISSSSEKYLTLLRSWFILCL